MIDTGQDEEKKEIEGREDTRGRQMMTKRMGREEQSVTVEPRGHRAPAVGANLLAGEVCLSLMQQTAEGKHRSGSDHQTCLLT